MKKFVSRKMRLTPTPPATASQTHLDLRPSSTLFPALPAQIGTQASDQRTSAPGPETNCHPPNDVYSSWLHCSIRTLPSPTPITKDTVRAVHRSPEKPCPSALDAPRRRAAIGDVYACPLQTASDAWPDSAPYWPRSAAKREH